MKKILFKRSTDPVKKNKVISMSQTTEDQESITTVTKGFHYKVSRTSNLKMVSQKPQVYINKGVDNKNAIETFDFKVKGHFYVSRQRMIYRVQFEHQLNIEINWKTKVFSPKKSVVLTK